MKAEGNIVYDGQEYKEGEEIWDLGSFVCVAVDGRKRKYEGLAKDVDKLPHYVGSGSSALCVDVGEFYKFHEPTNTWYKQ